MSLAEGMIFRIRDITIASQANISGGSSLGGTGNSGVDQITSISTVGIFDECIVEFDFIPDGDSINFNYVFASKNT